MKPKRLISLLVAVCMMITMLPLSAVTAFAMGSSWIHDPQADDGTYKYAYVENEDGDGDTVTITKFLGPVGSANPVDSANPDLYDIKIPGKLNGRTVTRLAEYSFSPHYYESYDLHHNIRSVTIPQSVTFIGWYAFSGCENLTTLTLGENIKAIAFCAFQNCSKLTEVTIPQSVTSIGDAAFESCGLHTLTIKGPIESMGNQVFAYCPYLESITLPAGFTSFGDSLKDCPAGCVFYYNDDVNAAKALLENPGNAVLKGHKLLYLCNVTFDANGGKLNDSAEVPVYRTEKITDTKANELTAIHDPTRAGYKFTGWYTEDNQPFDVNNTAITEDITLYAGWKFDPNAPSCHPLTVTGGTFTVKYDGSDVTSTLNSNIDAATGKKTYSVPDGAEVTVTLDKTLIPEGMVFDIWSTGKFSLPLGQDYKAETITFTMSSGVDIAAQYRDATIEDDEPDIVGPIVIGTTVVVGGAVLGYQAYSLGAEFAGKLMALPYFPSNRSALAMMLWEDAGKPMPESELLYPDVGQEEQDMDLQHAARWAMENELIPDLNDEGTAPEEMKFFPANPVSKLDVLNAWQKAQELKNN